MGDSEKEDRRLLLLRHAKAAPARDGQHDRDRPLLPVGREAARLLGRFLEASRNAPDLALTSPAVRARETAELVRGEVGGSCPLRELDALYEGTARGVLRTLRDAGGDAGCVLLVGHEPTWSDLASRLIGGGAIRLPTAGLVLVELPIESWPQARFGGAVLLFMVTPKLLGSLFTPR